MTAATHSQLVEFRNYRLVPGVRDDFVEYFETHFLESQEELGMDIVGQFRVRENPDRFVWIRRYRDPSARGDALARFYEGPVWNEFGPRANELMLEYHDVHLLVPDGSAPEFAIDHLPHANRVGRSTEDRSTVVAGLYEIAAAGRIPRDLAAAFDAALASRPEVSEVGRLVTAPVANEYPRLPIHEDVSSALWLLSDEEDGETSASLAREIAADSGSPLHVMRLSPTGRSTLG